MDEIDKKLKNNLKKKKTSEKYDEMIKNTMKMISNNEISRDEAKIYEFSTKKKKNRLLKLLQPVAAVCIIGLLGVTTYAGVTGKLNIDIGNTGHKKVDENYSEIASIADKKFENEYFTLTLESMAADPTYLIYEYNLTFTDKAMNEIGEIPYDEFDGNGYKIYLEKELYINDNEFKNNQDMWNSVQKINDNQFKIVDAYNIVNLPENSLNVVQKLKSLYIVEDYSSGYKLNVDIGEKITSKINFKDKEEKILAETKLSNGSTLYIQDIANSKFENYVLAKIVTTPVLYKDNQSRDKEFMIEDPQFAICDENDNPVNFEFTRLEEYFDKVSSDGNVIENQVDQSYLQDDDYIRIVDVQILKLGFDENNIPSKLKILPLNRKLYNDRNNSEIEFYKNEDWYEVKIGENNITEENTFGGSVTITKVEETEDKIIFYYDRKGFVPTYIDFVMRVKSPELNYWYPRKTEIKFVNGDENKIIYTKDLGWLAGAPLLNYERFDNPDELEFAMFYNTKYDILSEPLEFNWNPEENKEAGIVENIEIEKFDVAINDENGLWDSDGIVTEIKNDKIKFYSKFYKKELLLVDFNEFNFINGRTDEIIDLKDIEVGDYINILRRDTPVYVEMEATNDTTPKTVCVVKNLSGDKLKKELLKGLVLDSKSSKYFPKHIVNFEEFKGIEEINDNEILIKFLISDGYKEELENNEKFEIKFIIDRDTEIINSDYFNSEKLELEYFKNEDFKIEYIEDVFLRINKDTINDENPRVEKIYVPY